MSNKNQYFNWGPVLSRQAPITMVVGARGLGKTYGLRKACIEEYLRKGLRFVEVSRFKSEQKAVSKGYFARVSSEFPGCEFEVRGNEGFIWQGKTTEKGKKVWEKICFFVSLTELQTAKKRTFDGVHRIIFDEAVIDRTDRFHHYLSSEWELLAGLVDSVSRERSESTVHPQLFLLGNAVDLSNPYFQEIGLMDEPSTGFHWFMRKFFLLVVPEAKEYSRAKETQTVAGRMLAGTAAGEAANWNRFSNEFSGVIAKKPSTARFEVGLLWKDQKFGLWFDDHEGRYYVNDRIPPQGRVLALSIGQVAVNTPLVQKNASFLKSIVSLASIDGLRFESLGLRSQFFTACGLLNLL